MYNLLADAVLLVHFAFVVFVVASLPLVWIGALARWAWIRNAPFRIAHLLAILYVAGESVMGALCPLTAWEDALRGTHATRSFVARWLHRLVFYDLPESVFAIAYVAFAIAVAATYFWIPPRRIDRRGGNVH